MPKKSSGGKLPPVLIVPHQQVPGFPNPWNPKDPPARVVEFEEAILGRHESDDWHLCMYRTPGLDPERRCNKEAAAEAAIEIHHLALDFDTPRHLPHESKADAIAFLERLLDDKWAERGAAYLTRGGARLVLPLSRPVSPSEANEMLAGLAAHFEEVGGLCPDRAALKWHQLQRLPLVRRRTGKGRGYLVRANAEWTGDHFTGDPGLITIPTEAIDPDEIPRVQRGRKSKKKKTKAKAAAKDLSTLPETARDRISRYTNAALEGELDSLRGLRDGDNRRNRIFKAAAAIGEFVSAGSVSISDAEEAIRSANRSMAEPLDDSDLDEHMRNGLNRGMENPRDFSALESNVKAAFVEKAKAANAAQSKPRPKKITDPDSVEISPTSDTGLCRLLAASEDSVLYETITDRKGVERVFEAPRWVERPGALGTAVAERLFPLVKAEIRSASEEAKAASNDRAKAAAEARAALWTKTHGELQNNARQARVISVAKRSSDLAWPGDRDYENPNEITVPEGILDLETMRIRPGHREDFRTRMANPNVRIGSWEGDRRWVDFLSTAFDTPQERDYVQRCAGLALIGRSFPYLILAEGPTRSGKSTIPQAIHAALGGSYSVRESAEAFRLARGEQGAKRREEFNARILGASFVAVEELPDSDFLDVRMLKSIVDEEGHAIGRAAYAQRSEGQLRCVIWACTNHLPALAWEQAIRERIRVIHHRHTHTNAEGRTEGGLGLKSYLCSAEGVSTVFNWAAEGASAVIAEGYRLPDSPAAFAEREEALRFMNSPIELFLRERTEPTEDPDEFVPFETLRVHAIEFLEREELESPHLAPRRFKGHLRKEFGIEEAYGTPGGGPRQRCAKGIRLLPSNVTKAKAEAVADRMARKDRA